jgi:RNA 2',3'-cyclic 3'-phosphodiesterase
MAFIRTFIAVDITSTPVMLEFAEAIRKTGADVKLVEPQNIHITLKFLGDTDEQLLPDLEEIIHDAVTGVKPFTIQLQGTGVFPNRDYLKVLWVGIQAGEEMETIGSRIEEACAELGFKKERRAFSPHLTIGRVRTARNKLQLLEVVDKYKDTLFATEEVKAVVLKRSVLSPKGPTYSTLISVPLEG